MIRKFHNNRGLTIIELLVALLLTGLITAAGFKFYVSMHNTAMTQEEISNMQNTTRTSVQELTKTLRMAGYKLTNHAPYRISGDSLFVFLSISKPVDTVLYYLQNDSTVPPANGVQPQLLMKKVNSNPPAIFSDEIRGISYKVIDSSTVDVTVQVQTKKSDEAWSKNNGYRYMTMTEQVNIRNLEI